MFSLLDSYSLEVSVVQYTVIAQFSKKLNTQ